jgi:hypothetical protein
MRQYGTGKDNKNGGRQSERQRGGHPCKQNAAFKKYDKAVKRSYRMAQKKAIGEELNEYIYKLPTPSKYRVQKAVRLRSIKAGRQKRAYREIKRGGYAFSFFSFSYSKYNNQ